jgi:hypoxanthine-guanine phosphoribosyltransferase
MLFKPDAYIKDMKLDYVGLEIPNDFIVGYGLDYNGYGRNLRNIYTFAGLLPGQQKFLNLLISFKSLLI